MKVKLSETQKLIRSLLAMLKSEVEIVGKKEAKAYFIGKLKSLAEFSEANEQRLKGLEK